MAARRRKPPVAAGDGILVAKESGVVTVAGETYTFTAGVTRIRASHPAAKAAAHILRPIDVHYDVEQATANPGEKRGA